MVVQAEAEFRTHSVHRILRKGTDVAGLGNTNGITERPPPSLIRD